MNEPAVYPAPRAPRPRGTLPPRRDPPHSGGSGRAPSSLFASLSPSFSPPVVEGPRGGVDGTRNTFLNGIANCVTNLKPAATPGPCFVSGSYVTNKLTAAPLRLRNHSRGSFPTARGLAEASQNVSEEVPLHRHRLQLAPQPRVLRPLLARQRALRVLSLVDLRSLHPGPHARLCQPKLSRHGADALAAGPYQLHHLGLVLFRERPSRSRHGLHPPSHRRCPRNRGRRTEQLCHEALEDGRGHFRQGDRFRRVMTLKLLPERATDYFASEPLLSLALERGGVREPVPYTLAVAIHVSRQGSARWALNVKHRLVDALRRALPIVGGSATVEQEAADEVHKASIEELFRELHEMYSKIVSLSVSLLLEASSLEVLDAQTEAARAAFNAVGNSEL